MENLQEQLGLSEEKLQSLYQHPDFDNVIKSLEKSNPRFKTLPDKVKKLSMAVFLKGDTTKIEGMWKLFYKRPVPTIEEFLTKDYIGDDAMFYDEESKWRDDLVEIFKPGSAKFEFCLSGCIGAGKTAVSSVAHFYNLYRITSLRNPQMAIGTGGSKSMSLFVVSISKRKATDGLMKYKTLLKQCKFFKEVKNKSQFEYFENSDYCEIVPYCFEKENGFEKVVFPNGILIETGSNLSHSISSDIFGASFDEAEFKAGADAAKKMFDFYTELYNRINSRFIDSNCKLITLISSVKSDTGVIANHIKGIKHKKDTSHLSMYAIWEIKKEYRGSFEKYGHFWVLRGNKTHPSRIMDEPGERENIDKGILTAPDGCKLIKVPKHPTLLSDFKVNPDRALRDNAGEFAAGGERPFDDLEHLEDDLLWPELHFVAPLKSKGRLFDQLPVDHLFTKSPNGMTLKRYPNAKRYCFTGDTKVKLLDGTSKSMEELTKEHNEGKENWVYSWTNEGWKAGKIESAHISKYETELLEIELDNGEKIKCTKDHKFMLRDGSYKEAQYLLKNESLMPIYTDKNEKGYEYLIDNSNGNKVYTHRIMDNLLKKEPLSEIDQYYVRHHIDFNKLNNNPDNLVLMGNKSHIKLHQEHVDKFGFKQRWKDEKFKKKMKKVNAKNGKINGKKSMLNNWHGKDNKKWREKLKPIQRKSGSRNLTKYNNDRFHGSNSEYHRNKSRETLLKTKNNPKLKEKLRLQNVELGKQLAELTNSDPVNIQKRYEGKIKAFYKLLLSNGVKTINKETWDCKKYRKGTSGYPRWDSIINKLGSVEELKKLLNYNHTVININKIQLKKCVPVYDLTIEDETNSHNFALDAGIIVSNCHLDLGETGTAGISMCHKEVSLEGKIVVVFDFYGKITSPDRISLTKIENFITDLVHEGGVNLSILSADQYQSTHMRQRLEHEHRISAKVVKTPMGGETNIEPFNLIGTMISDGALKVGETIELKNQLKSIYIYNDRIQYETDRKDIVDTVIGSAYIAINNTRDIPLYIYEKYKDINSKELKIEQLPGFSVIE